MRPDPCGTTRAASSTGGCHGPPWQRWRAARAVLLALAVAGAGAALLAGLLLLRLRARPLRSPLAVARRAQPRRGSLGGRRAARARATRGGGVAAASFAAVAGRGDIDSVAIAPTGVGFAIETKTRTYDERHLGRVVEQARVAVVAADGGGAVAGRFRSSASFARRESSATSKVCWWSRSTGSFPCCGRSPTGGSAVS